MDYIGFFKGRIDELRAEGRYRVFADIEWHCGRFPRAFDHRIGAEVTVWCSNDYLGMGSTRRYSRRRKRRCGRWVPAPAAPAIRQQPSASLA